jgi:glucosamine-6-phosphate deaminase
MANSPSTPLPFRVIVCPSPEEAGRLGAALATGLLNRALQAGERARLLLSTGQSQFETLAELVRRPVDWSRVDTYHLDEYVGLSADHPASFRRYLADRFAAIVPAAMHYVDPSDPGSVAELSRSATSAPMDVALVGIGENGHIAFNDPPADLDAAGPYIVVDLDERCRRQQVGEGWFAGLSEVPERAVTMTVSAILTAKTIISVVPHSVKAQALRRLLESTAVTADLPATVLALHPDSWVVLDRASAGLLSPQAWARCTVL